MDYFIGYSQADKIALLRGYQEALNTGQIVKVQTAPGVYTEFSPNVDNSLMYQRLCDSIANSPDFDADDPVQAACRRNSRPSQTRARFC